MMKLSKWQDSLKYPNIRNETRIDQNGKEIAYLLPEGMRGSQCWVWLIYGQETTPSGSDLDREVARKQADEKLVELGYELEKGD